MAYKIVFRCDAGTAPEIGTGHIIRCLVLADALIKDGLVTKNDILFLTRQDAGYDIGNLVLSGKGYNFQAISDFGLAANSSEEKESLVDIDASLIIMDRLETAADLIASIKACGKQVITFDDYGSGRKHADIAICAIFDDVEMNSNLKSGYSYLILSRNDYFPKTIANEPSRLVATFGGYDARNLCSHFLDCLNTIPNNIQVDIILGKTIPDALDGYNKRVTYMNKAQQVRFFVQPENYHDLISAADVGVSSGGLSIFEFAAWGVPTIGLPQYPHQLRTIKKLQESGISRLGANDMVLDEVMLCTELTSLISSCRQRIEMAQCARALIDGQAVSRVINLIDELKQNAI